MNVKEWHSPSPSSGGSAKDIYWACGPLGCHLQTSPRMVMGNVPDSSLDTIKYLSPKIPVFGPWNRPIASVSWARNYADHLNNFWAQKLTHFVSFWPQWLLNWWTGSVSGARNWHVSSVSGPTNRKKQFEHALDYVWLHYEHIKSIWTEMSYSKIVWIQKLTECVSFWA